jgi:hypothetical protein
MDWNNVAEWFSQPKNAVLLGNAASAVMGPHQNTWQAQGGQVAANFGQSKIANLAAQKQQADRLALVKALTGIMGGGGAPGAAAPGQAPLAALTPEGEPGPTERTEKADGTYVEKGNVKSSGPVATPAKPQANAGAEVGARLVPFSLAEALLQGSGGMPDLTGLSPEQISQIMKTDQTGTALMNQAVGSIFENQTNQSLANLYDAKARPTTTQMYEITRADGAKVQVPVREAASIINAESNAAKTLPEIRKLRAEYEKLKTETGYIDEEIEAKLANAEANLISARASESQAKTAEGKLEVSKKNAETLEQDADTRARDLKRLETNDERAFESELAIHEGNADADEDNVGDASVYNRVVPGTRSKYYAIRDGEAKAYSLPKIQTPDGVYQLTMDDIRKLQKGEVVAGLDKFKDGSWTQQEILNIFADRIDSMQRK